MLHFSGQRGRILQEMHNSSHNFHATGSLVFSTGRMNDLDFFTSETARTFLEKLGFVPLSNSETEYVDCNTLGVYRHRCGIDVQLIDYVVKKIDSQNLLLQWGELPFFTKEKQRHLWDLAFLSQEVI